MSNWYHLFDPENCPNCFEEMRGWDWEQYENEVKNLFNPSYKDLDLCEYKFSSGRWVTHPNNRLLKDPRKEKRKDFRNSQRGSGWRKNKETTSVRKMSNRKFRRKMKMGLSRYNDYRPLAKEYKTYGWISW